MLSKSDLDERFLKARRAGEENDAKRRAALLDIPYLNLISVTVPTEVKALTFVKSGAARAAKLVPFQLLRNKLFIGAFDPHLPEAATLIEELKKKHEVQIFIVSLASLEHAWSYYRYAPDETKGN